MVIDLKLDEKEIKKILEEAESKKCPPGREIKIQFVCAAGNNGNCCPQNLENDEECWDVSANPYFDPKLETFSHSAKYRGSKSWLSKIVGLDPKYMFKREFLNGHNIEDIKMFDKNSIKEGDILERGSKYYSGSGNLDRTKEYFEVQCIGNKDILLRRIDEKEIPEIIKSKPIEE